MHSVSTHLIIAKVEEFPSQALHSSARGQGVHVLLPAAPPHRRQPEAGLRFRADSAASPLQPPAGKEPRAKGRGQATCGFLGPPDLGWMQWTELRRQLCGPEPNASRLWWTPGCPPWHAGLSSTFSWAMLLRRAPRPHPRASRASGAVGLGQARRPRTGAVTGARMCPGPAPSSPGARPGGFCMERSRREGTCSPGPRGPRHCLVAHGRSYSLDALPVPGPQRPRGQWMK
jgi:hypothetical protein